MDISEFIAIGIVGAALSLVIEWVKGKFGVDSLQAKGVALGLSVVVGTAYVLLRDTAWWTTVLMVLMAASTVYALFLRK